MSLIAVQTGETEIIMGTKNMWTEFHPKTEDQGIATHVYTAFSPDIKSELLGSASKSQVTYQTANAAQVTTDSILMTAASPTSTMRKSTPGRTTRLRRIGCGS